jgi:hypothetical protein
VSGKEIRQPGDPGVLREVIKFTSEEARTRGFPPPSFDEFGFVGFAYALICARCGEFLFGSYFEFLMFLLRITRKMPWHIYLVVSFIVKPVSGGNVFPLLGFLLRVRATAVARPVTSHWEKR